MPNILIADDEPEIIRLLKIYLEADHYRVFAAADGRQALDILDTQDIDLALVDTKEQIYRAAWYDTDAVDDNTIRLIISRLRDEVGSEHIKTIRGLGYRYDA